ncbi:MAG: hypothetical protein IAE93_05820 [Ignavibacteria bacterium]|nr:hypothetical protein [Ignavibacteria bacterium]
MKISLLKYIVIFIFIFTLPDLFAQKDSVIVNDSLVFKGTIGKFKNAVSISTAREEFIFVSDLEDNKIYKLSTMGVELASFGGSGLGQNELNQPYSIDASNGLDVLVADYQNNRIKRLDINLNYILSFDFNSYNLTAESSNKIYNPNGVMTLSTGEVYVLCDATNYKAARINDYNEIGIFFGSNSIGAERLDEPVKLVKGNQLDMWILDKKTGELLNFNNFGVFVKKISKRGKNPIKSIAYFNDNLFILHSNELIIYDLKRGQYSKYYSFPETKNLTDIAVLDKNTVLLLSKDSVHKYSIQ